MGSVESCFFTDRLTNSHQGRTLTAQLPPNADYSTGWVVQKTLSDDRIRAFAYHAASNRFVLGTSRAADFKLPADDYHPEWAHESEFSPISITMTNNSAIDFLPQMEKDTIKLYDPMTRTVVDTYHLTNYEVVMSIKSLSLEVSEHTHARKPLIVIGTAIVRGEDCQTAGRIHILEIIEVVPEPGHPETSFKFNLTALEDIKGAVTALSSVGTEGLLLIAEGQKCLVRGLKEDGTFLPVALMDMQCYASVVKELPESGLCILGDAVRGLWFAGDGVGFYAQELCLCTYTDLMRRRTRICSSSSAAVLTMWKSLPRTSCRMETGYTLSLWMRTASCTSCNSIPRVSLLVVMDDRWKLIRSRPSLRTRHPPTSSQHFPPRRIPVVRLSPSPSAYLL